MIATKKYVRQELAECLEQLRNRINTLEQELNVAHGGMFCWGWNTPPPSLKARVTELEENMTLIMAYFKLCKKPKRTVNASIGKCKKNSQKEV